MAVLEVTYKRGICQHLLSKGCKGLLLESNLLLLLLLLLLLNLFLKCDLLELLFLLGDLLLELCNRLLRTCNIVMIDKNLGLVSLWTSHNHSFLLLRCNWLLR